MQQWMSDFKGTVIQGRSVEMYVGPSVIYDFI